MKYIPHAVLLLLLLLPAVSFSEGYKIPRPGDRFITDKHLPANDDYRTQWWYITVHLEAEDGRKFGSQLTFFRHTLTRAEKESAFAARTFYFVHSALSDISAQKHLFFDEADRGAFGYSGASTGKLDVFVGKHRLSGSPGQMKYHTATRDYTLTLDLKPQRAPVAHGKKGYSLKSASSPDHSSLYASWTRMQATGTLLYKGEKVKVKGLAWFDRELFSSPEASGAVSGWDWFAVQMDDGRDLMIYRTRTPDGSPDPASAGTLVFKNGKVLKLPYGSFQLKVLDWYRTASGTDYPARWSITVPKEKIDILLTPMIPDQEADATHTTGNRYWEGAATVTGSVTGRAYIEMTGYSK